MKHKGQSRKKLISYLVAEVIKLKKEGVISMHFTFDAFGITMRMPNNLQLKPRHFNPVPTERLIGLKEAFLMNRAPTVPDPDLF